MINRQARRGVERSEAAVRQLGSRAREHVRERRQRFAPLRTILDAGKVARFLVAVAQGPVAPGVAWTIEQVNGAPALVVTRNGEPRTVFALEQVDGLISRIYLPTNPDKLTGIRATG